MLLSVIFFVQSENWSCPLSNPDLMCQHLEGNHLKILKGRLLQQLVGPGAHCVKWKVENFQNSMDWWLYNVDHAHLIPTPQWSPFREVLKKRRQASRQSLKGQSSLSPLREVSPEEEEEAKKWLPECASYPPPSYLQYLCHVLCPL